MAKTVAYLVLLGLVGPLLLPLCAAQESLLAVIDGYTAMGNFANEDEIRLGRQLILVCRVVGLPYGTPLNYTWTCPNGPCEVEGDYGRKVYKEHILAINTTSPRDGGTYTCQVTAIGGSVQQETRALFRFAVVGGVAVHSYGRLIPINFLVTEPEQIEGPDGVGRVNCTTPRAAARFQTSLKDAVTEDINVNPNLYQIRSGNTATLIVNNIRRNFKNRKIYCNSLSHFFFLQISGQNLLPTPRPIQVTKASTRLQYQVAGEFNSTGQNLIGALHVTRFGVPMVAVYTRVSQSVVVVQSVVPGARYDIAVWGVSVDNTRRSGEPSRQTVVVEERRPSVGRRLRITRVFETGVELNWLASRAPNGEVHYVIYYTPEGGTEQSIDTGSNLTHYNLTGLERNRVYTNISVEAVNSAGRSERSAAITQYTHTLIDEFETEPSGQASSVVVIVVLIVVIVLLVVFTVLLVVVMVILVRRKKQGDLDLRVYDTVHETVNESVTQEPSNYEVPVSVMQSGKRASAKDAHVYHTAMSGDTKGHHSSSQPIKPPLTNSNSTGDKNGSIAEEEDYVEMYEDMSGADAQYQSLRADQVQVHHYASLGATAQGEKARRAP